MAWLQMWNPNTSAWVNFPDPKLGSGKYTFTTNVDGGRNANGDFIGATVGRDKIKFECEWAALSPEEFQMLLGMYDKDAQGRFVNLVRLFDPRVGYVREFSMYVGDRQGRPYKNGEWWLDVSANLIET